MTTLASLVVSLEANIARFESDLSKAEFMAKKAMDTIGNVSESAMKVVKGAVAAMAAAYTFDAFADGIKGAIASAAELDQMAKKTGATVEALSGLKSAAKLSGTSLDEVGGGLQKLARVMFEAAGGSEKQSELFKTLGIEVTDSSGRLRDSGEVMLDLAKKLDSMDSSTQAVATAQLLLGKRGAELLPFLQDLAEIGELNAKVTADMAAEADAYEKNLVRLEARKKALYNVLAQEVVPILVDFTDAMLSAGSAAERLGETARGLQQDNVLETWARNVARFVAAVVDVFDAAIRVIRIMAGAIVAVAADIVSTVQFLDGIVGEMIKEGSLEPARRRFEKFTAQLKGHAETFNEDMARIWNAPLFLTRLEEQFAKRDAGITRAPPRPPKQRFDLPDQRAEKTSAFDSHLASLDVELIRDRLGKYEAMIEKARLLATKEGRLREMSGVRATVARIQSIDEEKRLDAFTRSLDSANQHYAFQTTLIGRNAREQEIATLERRNRLAVEQQIQDAEKNGMRLSSQAQQRLRDEATRSTAVMIEAIDARWQAERAWETGVSKAMNSYLDSVSNAALQSERLFSNAFRNMEDALVRFVQTGKLDFKSLANSIIADLIRIQIQNTVMKPLAEASSAFSLKGIFSGAGDFLSGLFRAAGGPVAAGEPYIVGEQGPEWFVPDAAGTILPAGRSPQSRGGDAATSTPANAAININFSVRAMDARSFQSAMVQNREVVVGIVNQALNMRGRYGITA